MLTDIQLCHVAENGLYYLVKMSFSEIFTREIHWNSSKGSPPFRCRCHKKHFLL